MSQDEANELMYRELLDGKEFDHLIPEGKCKSSFVGKGMTDFSIVQMKAVVDQFNWQADDLADVLERENLEQTCVAIHHFLYKHFQYSADANSQFLRTLACSWFDRRNGIDCKSYSISSSCILTSLGIKHMIRRINQDAKPGNWSHVYVIVPRDQNTGNIENGYITIDGTLPTMDEPFFTYKSDEIMSMPHFVLNGSRAQSDGLGLAVGDIKNYMNALSCIGGSAYKDTDYKNNVAKIVAYFDENIAAYNQAIANKQWSTMATEAVEIIGMAKLMAANFRIKRNEKNWNSCSGKLLDRTIDLSKFYSEKVVAALEGHLSTFFIKGISLGTVTFTASAANSLTIWGLDNSTGASHQEIKYNYTPKGTANITKFEITQYVADTLANPAQNIDISQFLKGLSTVIASFNGSTVQNPNVTSPTIVTDPNTGEQIVIGGSPNDSKQFGMSSLIGWGLLLGGGIYAFTQMKSQPIKKQTNARTAKK